MSRTRGLDRRRFLQATGCGLLALPLLQAFAPRAAFGQTATAPRRLVVVVHRHGRIADNGRNAQDNWSPRGTTGPLPATGDLSPMLKGLGAIRNELVTIDGIDNLVRHTTGDGDGHWSAARTFLTCQKPTGAGGPGGPSLDYIAGQRLRASATQRTALVLPASPLGFEWQYDAAGFYGAAGTPPTLINSNPKTALTQLFGPASVTGTPTPTPTPTPVAKTLLERLVARRRSILDGVATEYEALRPQVTASDRVRLDEHAAFLRTLESRFAAPVPVTPPPVPQGQGCSRPLEAQIPSYGASQIARGRLDGQVTPFQIENLVMALACDVTRVASLHFELQYDPTFSSEFSGVSPFDGAANYHAIVHSAGQLSSSNQPNLTRAFGHYTKMFTQLITRLGEVTDVDGKRLLDNTLVLWVSDMGYGAAHYDFNVPVVMAGMKSAFVNGQGRHLVCSNRRSLGDLYAQVLRMLGGSDQTFGATGTIGAVAGSAGLNASTGFQAGYVTSSLPLHLGPLDL